MAGAQGGMTEAQVDARVQLALSNTHAQLTGLVTDAQAKQVELSSIMVTVDQKIEHLNNAMNERTVDLDTRLKSIQVLAEDLTKNTTYLNEQNVEAQGVVDQVKGALGKLNAKIDQVNGLTTRIEQDVKDRADIVVTFSLSRVQPRGQKQTA